MPSTTTSLSALCIILVFFPACFSQAKSRASHLISHFPTGFLGELRAGAIEVARVIGSVMVLSHHPGLLHLQSLKSEDFGSIGLPKSRDRTVSPHLCWLQLQAWCCQHSPPHFQAFFAYSPVTVPKGQTPAIPSFQCEPECSPVNCCCFLKEL